MAKNWLYINGGKVVGIVNQDVTPDASGYNGTYDTLAQDDSQTFKVGDDFTAELQLQYNKTIWEQLGWIQPLKANTTTNTTTTTS